MPGISPVTFSQKAVETVKNRKTKVQSWFLDLSLVMNYWSGDGKRAYHHTAPVNSMYALHESLLMLKEEGIENSWKRHLDNHQILKAGLLDLGFEYVVAEESRTPQLNAVRVPNGIDEAKVRRQLLDEYNLELGAGLGDWAGKVWRIGLMGSSSNQENIDLCLSALKKVMG